MTQLWRQSCIGSGVTMASERALQLMAEKDEIEKEIREILSELGPSGLDAPLVDGASPRACQGEH